MKLRHRALLRVRTAWARTTRYVADLSIRNKIIGIILIATVSLLGLAFLVLIQRDLRTFREDMVEQTKLVASVLHDHIALALLFEIPEDLDFLPGALEGVPQISAARIYTRNCRLFFDYKDVAPPEHLYERICKEEGFQEEEDGHLHFVEPVYHTPEEEEGEGRLVRLGTVYMLVSTQLPSQKTSDYLTSSLSLLFILIVASVFLAFLLERAISRPILNLAGAARKISAQHDYSIRVGKTSDDEIGALSDGFNDMLIQIEKRQEELERSNRDLDQFAYVASHDLKAPLRAISTLSQWIDEDLSGDASEETGEQLRLLRGRVHRMERLIDGILAYSRVGRKEADVEQVDVTRLLREVVELLSPPPGFRVLVTNGMPILTTRRVRLHQVFSNLIGNALKYHDRSDGTVEVSVRSAEDYYEFSVTDDGPGIAPEYHDKVFLIFHTLQARDDLESTGIGLAVVKKILEDQGCRISIKSSVGRGTTFSFTWPKANGFKAPRPSGPDRSPTQEVR